MVDGWLGCDGPGDLLLYCISPWPNFEKKYSSEKTFHSLLCSVQINVCSTRISPLSATQIDALQFFPSMNMCLLRNANYTVFVFFLCPKMQNLAASDYYFLLMEKAIETKYYKSWFVTKLTMKLERLFWVSNWQQRPHSLINAAKFLLLEVKNINFDLTL